MNKLNKEEYNNKVKIKIQDKLDIISPQTNPTEIKIEDNIISLSYVENPPLKTRTDLVNSRKNELLNELK